MHGPHFLSGKGLTWEVLLHWISILRSHPNLLYESGISSHTPEVYTLASNVMNTRACLQWMIFLLQHCCRGNWHYPAINHWLVWSCLSLGSAARGCGLPLIIITINIVQNLKVDEVLQLSYTDIQKRKCYHAGDLLENIIQ